MAQQLLSPSHIYRLRARGAPGGKWSFFSALYGFCIPFHLFYVSLSLCLSVSCLYIGILLINFNNAHNFSFSHLTFLIFMVCCILVVIYSYFSIKDLPPSPKQQKMYRLPPFLKVRYVLVPYISP